jgi:hypothetical protein
MEMLGVRTSTVQYANLALLPVSLSPWSLFFLGKRFILYYIITNYVTEDKCWVAGDGHQPYSAR